MSDKTGRITVPTAGTAVQGPDINNPAGFLVTFPTTNTGTYGLISGNVTASSDYATSDADTYTLEEGKSWVTPANTNLSTYFFDVATNGDHFDWIVL